MPDSIILLIPAFSLMALLAGLYSFLSPWNQELAVQGGWAELSLPFGLGATVEEAPGWEQLPFVFKRGALDSGTPVPEEPGQDDFKGDSGQRIRFCGSVEGRAGTEYCFLDTQSSLWAWVAPGKEHAEMAVRLRRQDDGIQVEDIRDGITYLLDRERGTLVPLQQPPTMINQPE